MRPVAIRDAATVILVRDPASAPRILMGRRGRRAAFMPDKFVFPGGAVDPADAVVPLATQLAGTCERRLALDAGDVLPSSLAAAAIREVWEETGLVLGERGVWPDPPPGWHDFAATGCVPSAAGLSFVFRAITPRGPPRRFDARFFLADSARIAGNIDELPSTGELSDLAWIPVAELRRLDLPFVTEVVLSEVLRLLPDLGPPRHVPFFRNDDEAREIVRLDGRSPLGV